MFYENKIMITLKEQGRSIAKGAMFLIKKLHEKGIVKTETHETPAEEETMAKEVFESNMAAIKANVDKYDAKDSLRVFASVCKIVDGAFLSSGEVRDPKLKDTFLRRAERYHKILIDRYGVRDRSSLIQAILKELGMDELVAINLTEGKLEVEETIKEMIGLK